MVITRDMLFTPANANRRLHIYLPEGYFDSDGRYPVMYFFDGQNLFHDHTATYGKSWGLADFLNGWWKRMLIVGIECSHVGDERLAEYCPYDYAWKQWGNIHGTGKETLQWMVDTLKPHIDREFRTYTHREATGIGGSSMGGLMSLYGAVVHNDVFSKAACLSSSVGPGMHAILKDLTESPVNPDTRVYLSWGEEEAKFFRNQHPHPLITKTAQNNYVIAGVLRQRGCAADVCCQYGGRHTEADWEKQIPRFMHFLWEE